MTNEEMRIIELRREMIRITYMLKYKELSYETYHNLLIKQEEIIEELENLLEIPIG
ncbi:hypothetical protein [Turicibacter sp.]|uniref:hypothetical protein n=1 Tax=Turicibacter sp. TaxID=2049042 RepID=UPI001B5D0A1D|nr:hypothetical protein [Turicibacter sp.]MBP3903999.1 hypothetical protein [Turicibacter sp.]